MATHKLVSFDVVSLFTKVPLKQTISIILDDLYKDKCYCSHINNKKTKCGKKKTTNKRGETCTVCLDRSDMKWLLETATSRTHFQFNGKIFSQVDGVAMGSPVGPLIANIFMVYLEKKLMKQLEQRGLVYWKRYVDDTLAIIKKDADINKLLTILNSFHSSIQFTIEPENEKDQSIPFLDILIRRHSVRKTSWFSSSIYKKPTFTGLILKWNSFVPLYYKRGAISSMVYRAIRITSDYVSLDKEFIFIRQIAVSNGYPLSFVLNVIRTTLERHLEPKTSVKTNLNKIQHSKRESKKSVSMVNVPFTGRLSLILGKKLMNIAKQVEPSLHVQPILRPFLKVQSLFARKDPIPKSLLSNVVYNISCMDCSASYIGKTNCQITRRFEEHGYSISIDLSPLQSSQTPPLKSCPTPLTSTLLPSPQYPRRIKHTTDCVSIKKPVIFPSQQPTCLLKTLK